MDQINILKAIQLPKPMTGDLASTFKDIDTNFTALGSSTYTAGKDGVTRTHTLKFKGVEVENRAEFKDWLTSQLGISTPDDVVNGIVNAFANYKKNDDWYANGSYEIYIGTDGNIKEALPILYVKDNTISYLGFEYEDSSLTGKDVLILKPKKDVLGIDGEGYWVINGIKTDIKARGEDGTNGSNGSGLDFGFVTVEHAKQYVLDNKGKLTLDDEGNLASNDIDKSILVIRQYYDLTGNNNYVMDFAELSETKRKQWFDNNRDKVFLFTYKEDGKGSKTYIGYITKYDNTLKYEYYDEENKKQTINGYIYPYQVKNEDGNYSWVYNVDSSLYGFYYSDATIYSPGIGSNDLITFFDNMRFDQTNSQKPRGIWFRNTENGDDAIFMYNENNILNIGEIDEYERAYNTGDIETDITKVKVNGDFECDGATINNGVTINGETTINSDTTVKNILKTNQINSIDGTITINDNLKLYGPSLVGTYDTVIFGALDGNTIGQNRVSIYSSKGSEQEELLGLTPGDRYIQVASNHNMDGVDDWKITHVCPGMITVYYNEATTTISDSGISCNSASIKQIEADNIALYTLHSSSPALSMLTLDKNGLNFKLRQDQMDTFENKYYFHNDGELKCSNITTNEAKITTIIGNVTINGTLQATSISTSGSTGGNVGDVAFNNLTVSNDANIANITTTSFKLENNDDDFIVDYGKVLLSNKTSGDYMEYDTTVDGGNNWDSSYFTYTLNTPNLINDIYKDIYKDTTGKTIFDEAPQNINLHRIYKNCDIQIKYCDSHKIYIDGDTIYSYSKGDSYDTPVNFFKIKGVIYLNYDSLYNVSGTFNPNIHNRPKPNQSSGFIPNHIQFDEYFAIYKNSNNKKYIFIPYGFCKYGMIPHCYCDIKEDKIYKYSLNSLCGSTKSHYIKNTETTTVGDNTNYKYLYGVDKDYENIYKYSGFNSPVTRYLSVASTSIICPQMDNINFRLCSVIE